MTKVVACKKMVEILGIVAGMVILQGCASVDWVKKGERQDPVCHAGLDQTTIAKQSNYDKTGKVSYKNDSAMLGGKVVLNGKYTLLDLVNFSLEHNNDVRQAWFAAKQKAASYGIAKSRLYPTVDVSAIGARTQVGEIPSSGGGEPTRHLNTFQPAVAINYKLFQFGSDRAAIDAAKDRLYAANLQFNRSLQTVIYHVQQDYYKFYAASETVRMRLANYNDARSALNAVEKKKDVGLANIQSFLQAQSNWLKADYDYKSSLAEVENCRAALAETVGVTVSKKFEIALEEIQAVPLLEKDIEGLVEKTLKGRQDLHAQQVLMTAASEDASSQERALLPKFIVGLSSNVQKYEGQGSWQRNYQGFVGLQWNFFDGLNSTYTALLARRQKAAQKETLRNTEIKAVGDVWRAFHGLQAAVKQLHAAQAFLAAALKSFDAIKIGYENGINNVLDLLSSQTSLSQARLFKVQAETNFALSLAKLAYSIGDKDSNKLSMAHYEK